MPVSLHTMVEELLALGVPGEFLDGELASQKDPRGLHHAEDSYCYQESEENFQPGVVTLGDIPVGEGCSCLLSLDYHPSSSWRFISQLTRILTVLEVHQDNFSVMDLRDRYRGALSWQQTPVHHKAALGDVIGPFREAAQNLLERLQVLEGELFQELRTQRCRTEILQVFRVKTGRPVPYAGEPILVGLSGSTQTLPLHREIDALFLSHGTSLPGRSSAVVPQSLGLQIMDWTEALDDFNEPHNLHASSALVHESDTPAILEMAQVLWSPGEDQDLSDIEYALQAARRLT